MGVLSIGFLLYASFSVIVELDYYEFENCSFPHMTSNFVRQNYTLMFKEGKWKCKMYNIHMWSHFFLYWEMLEEQGWRIFEEKCLEECNSFPGPDMVTHGSGGYESETKVLKRLAPPEGLNGMVFSRLLSLAGRGHLIPVSSHGTLLVYFCLWISLYTKAYHIVLGPTLLTSI